MRELGGLHFYDQKEIEELKMQLKDLKVKNDNYPD